MCKYLVLITSVINITNNPLSYTLTRSVYQSERRYQDTLKTIDSIYNFIPECKIVFVECSKIEYELENSIRKRVDFFINLYDILEVRQCVESRSKSLGEGTMTIEAIKFIQENNINYENLIKISGRYWLNEAFNINNFDNKYSVIKPINGDENNIATCLYKLPREVICDFLEFLKFRYIDMQNCIGYEVLFAQFIDRQQRVVFVKEIGISGYVSVSLEFYNG